MHLGNRMKKRPRAVASLLSLVGATVMVWIVASGTALAGSGGAPELDPGSAASGIALLIGGAALLLERYRRR
jgi:hypothetical protein